MFEQLCWDMLAELKTICQVVSGHSVLLLVAALGCADLVELMVVQSARARQSCARSRCAPAPRYSL